MGNNHFVKRPFLMFTIFCLVIVSVVTFPTTERSFFLKDLIASGEYCFYADVDCEIIPNARIVQNGISAMVYCDSNDAYNIKQYLKNIYGESITKKDATNIDKNRVLTFCQNYKVREESFDNLYIYYCYNNTILNYIVIDSRKVNVQVVLKGNDITVGTPIVLGEY